MSRSGERREKKKHRFFVDSEVFAKIVRRGGGKMNIPIDPDTVPDPMAMHLALINQEVLIVNNESQEVAVGKIESVTRFKPSFSSQEEKDTLEVRVFDVRRVET